MIVQEVQFAAALARAIAEDLRVHPPAGALVRVVIRWFEEDNPLNFGVHALGSAQRADVAPEDAWYPLEWANLEDEGARFERLSEHPDVQRTGAELAAAYQAGTSEPVGDDAWLPAPAILDAVRRLPAELRAAGLPLDDDFAAAAAHFEGMGPLAVLQQLAAPYVLAALAARGELPTE
ncbi:hypothetical protein NONI108955_25110 [Nocardia ninae]|uniref:DUF4303 domain-containing protein n=1 Tax=Nocardia ninae NBRC 108245 TaxID=1210091 RepID=A0A511MEM8_9NOCA|nr:hypothetical protein [Nocardia ninae]GEM38607.1 hypothetical protein NN4_31260 [Nocardia ninae NBRC 108245]